MKIVVKHIPNTLNYGSAMLAENLIHYLNAILDSEAEFFCDFSSEYDRERMELATRIKPLGIDQVSNRKPSSGNKISKVFNLLRRTKEEVETYESKAVKAILVLGGDDFSESYIGKLIAVELFRVMELSKKMSVFLIGQTVGPFHSWRIPLAKRCLRQCNTYTRDPLTYEYLRKNLRLTTVTESRDLAWLDLPRQNEPGIKEILMKKYDLEPDKYVTVVPSGLSFQYCSDLSHYIKSWKELVHRLAIVHSASDKRIVLLGHVVRRNNRDDREIIRAICSGVSKEVSSKLIPIYDVILPAEARLILGNSYFTVTGRMHAAVSAFQMGKPAISLSYSLKYKGVIGEGLGMKDLIIEARGDDLWESGKIVDLVLEKVEYVLSNYDSLVSRIKPAVEENKMLAMGQIEDIANKLKEKSYK